jgi:hypothetical protein
MDYRTKLVLEVLKRFPTTINIKNMTISNLKSLLNTHKPKLTGIEKRFQEDMINEMDSQY